MVAVVVVSRDASSSSTLDLESTLATLRRLLRPLRDEGVAALLGRGLKPRLLKIGLGQAVIFCVYDTVRRRLSQPAAA